MADRPILHAIAKGRDIPVVALVALPMLALFVLATGLWPLIRLFALAGAAGGDGAPLGLLRETLSGPAFRRALGNTLSASAGSVAVSALLGTALALAT